MERLMKHVFTLFGLTFALVVTPVSAEPVRTSALNMTTLNNAKIAQLYKFTKPQTAILIPPESQAAVDEEDDGDPTGPSGQISATYLADVFDAASPRHIRDDFENRIPFSDQIYRDHTSLNTFYFYPSGYLLKRDANEGFDINFLHRTRDDQSSEELIVLTFTLVPRELYGGMSLVRKLAAYGIEPPANKKPANLIRLPISDVKINLSGISALIPESNVKILNKPQKVGDPIRVQASMNQSQKEDLVASIRSGGMSGDITFKTNEGSFKLVIPYLVSFTDYSGDWLTDISKMTTSESIQNVSPFPLLFTGLVAYTHKSSEKQVKRYEIPATDAVLLEPGAKLLADMTFQELTSSYGEVVAAWAMVERVTCDECLNAIEQKILVSPAQAQRTELPIEVIPSLFDQFSVFKVLVEIRSKLFSPNNDYEDTKVITLRPDEPQSLLTLYINRDDDSPVDNFEYRVKPVLSSGEASNFSAWKGNQGIMDITVTAADIKPQIGED